MTQCYFPNVEPTHEGKLDYTTFRLTLLSSITIKKGATVQNESVSFLYLCAFILVLTKSIIKAGQP